jgi:hypothetical protein
LCLRARMFFYIFSFEKGRGRMSLQLTVMTRLCSASANGAAPSEVLPMSCLNYFSITM